MLNLKLFNFDHGFVRPSAVAVGPYTIEVSALHCENLSRLPQRAKHTYTWDTNGRPIVIPHAAQQGEFVETAVAVCSEEARPSVLFPGFSPSEHDLIVLLSFITGRRVYLEDDLSGDPRRTYGERLLSHSSIQRVLPNIWNQFSALHALGLSDALGCIINAPLAPDLIGRGAYANAAFDAICTSWSKSEKRTKYDSQPILERAKKKAMAILDETILVKSRNLLARRFSIENISQNIVADVTARIQLHPSALQKATWFLQKHELFPDNPSIEEVGRLKWLNHVRNAIMHSGSVYQGKGMDIQTSSRVSGAAVMLTHLIATYYIAHVALGLDGPEIVTMKSEVNEYFLHGTFRNQKVFVESYEQFMEKMEREWTEAS